MRRPPKPVLLTIIGAELVSAALAWRDLKRRSDASVRGPKKVWRVVILVNPGNSLAYWILGRR
jgi:hypothetical protein